MSDECWSEFWKFGVRWKIYALGFALLRHDEIDGKRFNCEMSRGRSMM